MRIHYMSDLHLEFGELEAPLPKGEVLLLAGDITLCRFLEKEEENSEVAMRTRALLEEASAKFKRVFILSGNHEPYDFNVSLVDETLRAFCAPWPNVKLLQDKSFKLAKDMILVGGTLWTEMRNEMGERAHDAVRWGMNDFQLVGIGPGPHPLRFQPEDAERMFRRTVKKIKSVVEKNPQCSIVVCTHHAPSFKGVNPEHGGSLLDAGYASDLELFIEAHPNIRFWVHGHSHVQTEYTVAQCKVMANCRGYLFHERIADRFNTDTWFETQACTGRSEICDGTSPTP